MSGYPDEWPEDVSAEWVTPSTTLGAALDAMRRADLVEVDEDTLTLTLYRVTDPDVRAYLDGPDSAKDAPQPEG